MGGFAVVIAYRLFQSVAQKLLGADISADTNNGLFRIFIGKVHQRFDTPYLALATYGSLIFIFSFSGGFKQLTILARAAIRHIFPAVILVTIQLRKQPPSDSKKTFRAPGALITPLIGIVTIVCLLRS